MDSALKIKSLSGYQDGGHVGNKLIYTINYLFKTPRSKLH